MATKQAQMECIYIEHFTYSKCSVYLQPFGDFLRMENERLNFSAFNKQVCKAIFVIIKTGERFEKEKSKTEF
jgi:hypothetical protein